MLRSAATPNASKQKRTSHNKPTNRSTLFRTADSLILRCRLPRRKCANDNQPSLDYGLDRRVAKRVLKDGEEELVTFVYDREDVILDFLDSDGLSGPNEATLAQRYLHGPAVDQVIAQENDAIQWLLADHLGTIRDIAISTGVLATHLKYSAFGVPLQTSPSDVSSRYAFTGRELDSEVELYYYRARYFEPILGRFLSVDPIGFQANDLNLYRYVKNEPVDRIDPSGNQASEVVKTAIEEGARLNAERLLPPIRSLPVEESIGFRDIGKGLKRDLAQQALIEALDAIGLSDVAGALEIAAGCQKLGTAARLCKNALGCVVGAAIGGLGIAEIDSGLGRLGIDVTLPLVPGSGGAGLSGIGVLRGEGVRSSMLPPASP